MAEADQGSLMKDKEPEPATTLVRKTPSKFTPNKVNPEQKDFILQQLAEGYKPEQVVLRLFEEYSLNVHINTVKRYKSLEENRILEKRRALTNQLDRLRASSKFIRVSRLEKQEDRLEANQDMEDKFKERLLLDNSEQQRKEIEGFKGILGFDPDNPFTAVKANLGDIERALHALNEREGKELKAKETVKKAEKGKDE